MYAYQYPAELRLALPWSLCEQGLSVSCYSRNRAVPSAVGRKKKRCVNLDTCNTRRRAEWFHSAFCRKRPHVAPSVPVSASHRVNNIIFSNPVILWYRRWRTWTASEWIHRRKCTNGSQSILVYRYPADIASSGPDHAVLQSGLIIAAALPPDPPWHHRRRPNTNQSRLWPLCAATRVILFRCPSRKSKTRFTGGVRISSLSNVESMSNDDGV